jgi:hypothetical protein
MMIPGVRLSVIRRASLLLEEERDLRRANGNTTCRSSRSSLYKERWQWRGDYYGMCRLSPVISGEELATTPHVTSNRKALQRGPRVSVQKPYFAGFLVRVELP